MGEEPGSRQQAKLRLSTATNNLRRAVDDPAVNASTLQELIEEFNRRAVTLAVAQNAYECQLNEAQLEPEIDAALQFMKEKNSVKHLAMDLLNRLSFKNSSDALPELVLPRFDGNIMEWTWFYDSFMYHIGSSVAINDITKFTYLRSLLDGVAKRSIIGLFLTQKNYNNALAHLKRRFGKAGYIRERHIYALINLEFPTEEDIPEFKSKLIATVDTILMHVRSLKALGISTEGEKNDNGYIISILITNKFPEALHNEWSKKTMGNVSLKHTLDFLNEKVRVMQNLQLYEPKLDALRRNNSSASSSDAMSDNRCVFCRKRGHKSADCFQFVRVGVNKRRAKVDKAGACICCLQPHLAHTDWLNDHDYTCGEQCTNCGEAHHAMLCTI